MNATIRIGSMVRMRHPHFPDTGMLVRARGNDGYVDSYVDYVQTGLGRWIPLADLSVISVEESGFSATLVAKMKKLHGIRPGGFVVHRA